MSKKITVGNLYNVGSFTDAADKLKAFGDSGVILARNLEHVSSEIFEQKFPGLTLLSMGGLTVNNEGGYADAITKLKTSVQGGFKMSGSNSNTKGKISIGAEQDTIPVFTKEAESDWSAIEVKKAELQNINLPQRFMQGHNELYNREIDDIGFVGQLREDGSTRYNEGLLNWSGFATAGATGAIGTLTAQQQYDEIATLITDQWNGVFNVPEYMANRVAMPDSVYNVIARTILDTAGGTKTVLKALQDNFPGVVIYATTKARSVDGASATVAYSDNRQAMQLRIPVPLEISNVAEVGHRYYVESYFGLAGLDVIEDTAGQIITGL